MNSSISSQSLTTDYQTKPLILITNDDGYQAAGIQALACAVASLGEVYVVAPDGPRSGAAASITTTNSVRFWEQPFPMPTSSDTPPRLFVCTGTPVDCVKLAFEQIVPRRPSLILSGINHGDNASISVHYSGTMGAVIEGCMKDIPSVGISLWLPRGERYENHPVDTDTLQALAALCRRILQNPLPQDVCLNINIPFATPFRGWRICRQARGRWSSEWMEAPRAHEDHSFLLTGTFTDLEPNATDTDFAALRSGFCSIVPVNIDMTAHTLITQLQTLIPPAL